MVMHQQRKKGNQIKGKFYSELDTIYECIPKRIPKIIMGDFNAKIGKEGVFEPKIGRESLHQISNDNGIRLITFAGSKNMWTSSTFFPHKRTHKQKWMSPNGTTKNQIDHLAMDNIIKYWIQDVRSHRGVGAHSDHFLVKTTLRLKPPRQWTQKPRDKTKLNVENTKKESIIRKYKQKMMTKLNTVEQSQDIQKKWQTLRTIIKTAAEEKFGLEPRRRQNNWFNNNCMKAKEDRDKARIEVLRSNNEEKGKYWHKNRKHANR